MTNLPYIAPQVQLPRDGGSIVHLPDLKPSAVVLFFYPRDNTSGCTVEAKAFTSLLCEFEALNTQVIGVSKDSMKKHLNFIDKQNLKIKLASDEKGEVTEKFGVWVEKKMYGRTYMGIERSTFIISGDGKVLEIFRKVKVKNHANLVLEKIYEILK